MKKFAVCLLIVAVVCTSAFASVVQVGGTARFRGDFLNVEDYKKIDSYQFGGDARFNLGPLSLATNVLFGKQDSAFTLDTILTANLRLDFKVVDLAVGAGYQFPVVFDNGNVTIAGKPASEVLSVFTNTDALLLRAAVGVNLGLVGVSVDYKIPLGTVIEWTKNGDYKNVDSYKKGSVAFSVLVNLF